MKLNQEIHDHYMHHKKHSCSILHNYTFRNCVANAGMKLYNKVPYKLKKSEDTGIQKKAEIFCYCNTFLLCV